MGAPNRGANRFTIRRHAGPSLLVSVAAAGLILLLRPGPESDQLGAPGRHIERLTDHAAKIRFSGAAGGPSRAPAGAARLRWSAAQIERDWTRVQAPHAQAVLLRSPRLEFAALDEIDSIVVSLAPSELDGYGLLWSEQPVPSEIELVRNRHHLPARPDRPTLALIRSEDIRDLPFDRDPLDSRPLRHLFLEIPEFGAKSSVVRAVEIVAAADRLGRRSGLARVTIGGEIRNVLYTPIPGQIAYTTELAGRAELLFGLHAKDPAESVRVTLTLNRMSSGQTELLFERRLEAGTHFADFRVPLPGAGRTILTLRVEADRHQGVLLWGNPMIVADADLDPSPNVVLYLLDTLRPDHLGFHGYPKPTSPFLDRLARRSLVFRRCYAAASWTKPSVASLLTGLHPQTHGVGARYYSDALLEGAATLQDRLRRHGYVTALFSANPLGGSVSNLDQGFDVTFTPAALIARETPLPEGKVRAAELHRRVLTWIEARAAQPFFAFIHSVDPHPPFDPPGPNALGPASSELEAYDAEIAYADAQLCRFYDRLVELGITSRTLLVVTSDHGRSFGQRGPTGHGLSVHEDQIRVPLLMHHPGALQAGLVEQPVHLVDVLPTILEHCSIAPPAAAQGRSLLRWKSDQRRRRPRRLFASRFVYPEDRGAAAFNGAEQHAVIEQRWKLIATEDSSGADPRLELFDLETDPLEHHDRSAYEPERTRRLQRALQTFLEQQEAARRVFLRARGQAGQEADALQGQLPGQLLEELRALGYAR